MDNTGFTIDELGGRFGALLAQAMANTIVLEKRLARAQQNEADLYQTIAELREEIARLKPNLSPELTALAAEARAVIDNKR